MQEPENMEFRPLRESSVLGAIAVVVLVLGAGALWWRWSHEQMVAEPLPSASAVVQPMDVAADTVSPLTGPQFPLAPIPAPPLPALSASDPQVNAALRKLFGDQPVRHFLQTDQVVRRLVVTIDNLPREKATVRRWPVHPAPGRFEVTRSAETQVLSPDNSARYSPFVRWVESIDSKRTVALYTRFYPLFQRAYEDLGYPGRYFNDRLVAVIDHLRDAPEPQGPLQMRLAPVHGEVPHTAPWLHYEFADPALESLSVGQKMMVRVGLANERRLKLKLAELRAQLVAGKSTNGERLSASSARP